jgi:O-antigen/teichoic acid export membrane protein
MKEKNPGRVAQFFAGGGLRARALRSSGFTVLGYGTSQVLRLASNLILTRILFPDAFGTMVLVSVLLMGLGMFSDLGVSTSIMQNKRGDDPEFLNTAWTIQVIRGFALWAATCILTWPMATFYDVPQLIYLLPVAGLTLAIKGFLPTRADTANRHLLLGRITVIDTGTQIVGIVAAVALAWGTQSVWALVISGIISGLAELLLYNVYMPGERNKFQWESSAANELVHFGKWIFLSTVAGFLVSQSDKIVLGKFLSLTSLGVYNIGFFIASFPLLLGSMVTRKIMIPLYRERPPANSLENFKKFHKLRMLLSAGIFVLVFTFAFLGQTLIQFLYDPRYAQAAGVVVLVACLQVPQVILLTYDQAALAAGDSKRFFVLASCRAVFIILGLLIGVQAAGLFGALLGQGIATLVAYPVVVWLARRHGAWDPIHDLIFAIIGLVLGSLAIWLNAEVIMNMAALM